MVNKYVDLAPNIQTWMDNKTDLTEQLTIITWNACTLTGKTDDLADTLTRQVIDSTNTRNHKKMSKYQTTRYTEKIG